MIHIWEFPGIDELEILKLQNYDRSDCGKGHIPIREPLKT